MKKLKSRPVAESLIIGVTCKSCGYTIFSRTRHDYRNCHCKKVAVDGGFDYLKVNGNYDDYQYVTIKFTNPIARKDLHADWSKNINYYGLFKEVPCYVSSVAPFEAIGTDADKRPEDAIDMIKGIYCANCSNIIFSRGIGDKQTCVCGRCTVMGTHDVPVAKGIHTWWANIRVNGVLTVPMLIKDIDDHTAIYGIFLNRSGVSLPYYVSGVELVPNYFDSKKDAEKKDVEKVDHPSHYNKHPSGIECIDVVEGFDFTTGNIIKYVWRAGLKDSTTKLEDLKKAKWYLERAIARAGKET